MTVGIQFAPPFIELPRSMHKRKLSGCPLLSNTCRYGAPTSFIISLAFTSKFLRENSVFVNMHYNVCINAFLYWKAHPRGM